MLIPNSSSRRSIICSFSSPPISEQRAKLNAHSQAARYAITRPTANPTKLTCRRGHKCAPQVESNLHSFPMPSRSLFLVFCWPTHVIMSDVGGGTHTSATSRRWSARFMKSKINLYCTSNEIIMVALIDIISVRLADALECPQKRDALAG